MREPYKMRLDERSAVNGLLLDAEASRVVALASGRTELADVHAGRVSVLRRLLVAFPLDAQGADKSEAMSQLETEAISYTDILRARGDDNGRAQEHLGESALAYAAACGVPGCAELAELGELRRFRDGVAALNGEISAVAFRIGRLVTTNEEECKYRQSALAEPKHKKGA